ncbi:MAG TPA: amidase [Gemmatimonadaceae bacterium]|nr:amidase [Gemmatimonadaceae bacterium]
MTTHFTRRGFIGAAVAAGTVPLLPLLSAGEALAAEPSPAPARARSRRASQTIDADLLEVTIPRLHALYDARKYTATQVTHWYLDRIAKYDRVYRSLLHVDVAGALATAAAQDAAAKAAGARFKRSALWGVPIVIKANTSVKGLVTSAGWSGYLIPGHELIAPADAPVVAKLKAAGAIILGQTNMPDFAASDTNISSAFGRTGNAYDPRFSPGGSSGGTVTAVTANFCVFGTGTDTSNSIRMPSGTSSVVGVLPTRGLTSIAGIHPLDWLVDNTGPIARDVTDAAIALDVMAGEDPRDFRTKGSAALAQPGPYSKFLRPDALTGKRFGVPAFMLGTAGGPNAARNALPLEPDARELFMHAVDGFRLAGATVVFDDALLTESFLELVRTIKTQPYTAEGVESFFRDFGPAEYHSPAEYARAVGSPLPFLRGAPASASRPIESDPAADATFWQPQRAALAAYEDTLKRFQLDGLVYPAAQMPPNDELLPLREGRRSGGPHSETGWVNPIGVPAIVVPGGFYASGLPFGIEVSGRRWKDGDLIGWAFAYEQATRYRKPPTLKDGR